MLTADLGTQDGRDDAVRFFTRVLDLPVGVTPVLAREPGRRFTDAAAAGDGPMGWVSLVNLASVRDLASRTGTVIDPIRFRANVFVDGLPAWSELDAIGRELDLGGVRVRAVRRTKRCAATEVGPGVGRRDLLVAGATDLTPTVRRFVLRDPGGSALPAYEPGAHIVVTTPRGHKRSYSLVDPGGARPGEYVVCVRRDSGGRGGSVSMHDDVAVGTTLVVSAPANRFPLEPSPRYLFIAGGIGITPIRAMVRRLRGDGRTGARLLYLTRSARETPFLREFGGPEDTVHHSDDRGPLDLWPYLAVPDDDVRVYCCGPAALVRAVRTLTAHWRVSRIHLEGFATGHFGVSAPFTAVWAPDGRRVEVPAHLSLLAALRRDGVRVDSSCEAGVCGTCRLAVLGGEVEHRDDVLTEKERVSSVVACVSRARSAEIVVGPFESEEPA